MKPGDGFDKAEPKPVSGGVTAAFEAIKPLKYVWILAGRNSRAIVRYRNDSAAIAVRNFNGHLPLGTAVFDRVIDEIRNRIKQEISITSNESALISEEAKMSALFLHRSIE
jgi:hypothetical protein